MANALKSIRKPQCVALGVNDAGVLVTVGNHRQVVQNGADALDCYLHGHKVARFERVESGDVKVTLDTCGYLTSTTISAMTGFMQAFGLPLSASRANGQLAAGRAGFEVLGQASRLVFYKSELDAAVKAWRAAGEPL